MKTFYARKSLRKIIIYVGICALIATVTSKLKLETFGGILCIPFIYLIGFEWFKSVFFKCPKCKTAWPLGFKSECRNCNLKYGDINHDK